MKIISKFHDYYDQVAYMYGGGDPKIWYERDKYEMTSIELPSHMSCPLWHPSLPAGVDVNYLIIGDKWFTLCADAPSTDYSIITKNEAWIKRSTKWSKNSIKKFIENDAHFNPIDDALLEIARRIKNPVYVVKNWYWNRSHRTFDIVDHYVPLFKYGIHKIYKPEQIYQDLSYFIANKMNETPDLQPPGRPPQTDKEKILSHGMDLKQSFRHRKV